MARKNAVWIALAALSLAGGGAGVISAAEERADVSRSLRAADPQLDAQANPAGADGAKAPENSELSPQNPPAVLVLSPQCQAPAADIASPAPLPHLAANLLAHKEIRILAIGSSSTFGLGASSAGRNYPAQLTDILEGALKGVDVEIINRGVSGEVAATTAERLRSETAIEHPDLILWQLGTNDALSRVPAEEFEKTVRSTIDWLKASKIDVVLVGLQYAPRFARDENYKAIRDALLKISASENVLYIRRYEAMQFLTRIRNPANMVSPDELHLNDQGYRCMAEHVAQAVIANLFPRRIRPNSDAESFP